MRARILRPSYQIPAQFNAEQFLSNAWGEVKDNDDTSTTVTEILLRVSTEIIPSISQQVWHPSQRIERQDDGFALVTLHLSDWRSMLPWIRSWGVQIEVLKPIALRKALAREALSIAEMYIEVQQVT